MTDLVDQAAEALRRMPPAERDSVAQAILIRARDNVSIDIEPEHLPSVLEGLSQIECGDVIEGDPDALVAAAFERQAHRRSPHGK